MNKLLLLSASLLFMCSQSFAYPVVVNQPIIASPGDLQLHRVTVGQPSHHRVTVRHANPHRVNGIHGTINKIGCRDNVIGVIGSNHKQYYLHYVNINGVSGQGNRLRKLCRNHLRHGLPVVFNGRYVGHGNITNASIRY